MLFSYLRVTARPGETHVHLRLWLKTPQTSSHWHNYYTSRKLGQWKAPGTSVDGWSPAAENYLTHAEMGLGEMKLIKTTCSSLEPTRPGIDAVRQGGSDGYGTNARSFTRAKGLGTMCGWKTSAVRVRTPKPPGLRCPLRGSTSTFRQRRSIYTLMS